MATGSNENKKKKPEVSAEDLISALFGGITNLPPATTPSGEDDPMVYLGPGHSVTTRNPVAGKPLPDGGRVPGQVTRNEPEQKPLSEVINDFERMNPTQQLRYAEKLEALGIVEKGNWNIDTLRSVWEDAAVGAARLYSIGGQKVTPEQYLNLLQMGLGTQAPPEDTFDPYDRRTVTRNVNSSRVSLTPKASARALITDAFRAELGRDPSRKEVRAFFSALRRAEKNHPSRTTGSETSTTETRRKRNGNVNETVSSQDNTVTRGGVDPGAIAQNYLDDTYDAERDARTTATEYYDALLGLAGF